MKIAEAVTEGHADKICDQMADAVLDAYLFRDPSVRAKIEVMGGAGLVVVAGSIESAAKTDIEDVVRRVYADVGYPTDIEILVNVHEKIAGPEGDEPVGQGIFSGYATCETPEMLPRPFALAQSLVQKLGDLRRHDREFYWLKPDGKIAVATEAGIPRRVFANVQHDPTVAVEEARARIAGEIMKAIPGIGVDNVIVNPKGARHLGGFEAGVGLTGRKLTVDAYGPLIPISGGAFSGKDARHLDRTAAYMCRYAAKAIVGNALAKSCMVTAAYSHASPEPFALSAKGDGGKDLSAVLREKFDFRPLAIIERLGLRQPIFRRAACYGHFGRPGFPWEEIASL